MKRFFSQLSSPLRPCAPQTYVIKNATVMTVAKGTFKGSILVSDGKIAEVGEKVMEPAGRQDHRRLQSVRDPRHHRLPLAHRRRWRHQRRQRQRVLHGGYQGRHQPRGHRHLPRAGRRRDYCQHSARLRQRHRRQDAAAQDALGQGRAGHDLRRRHAGHQVRPRRKPQARRQPHRARHQRPGATGPLPGHPHGRGRRHPRSLHRSQGLQGRVGRLRCQRRPAFRRAKTSSWKPSRKCSKASATSTRTATAPTKSSCCCASPTSSASRSARCSTCWKATRWPRKSRRTAPAHPPSATGGLTRWRPSTPSPTTPPSCRRRACWSPSTATTPN